MKNRVFLMPTIELRLGPWELHSSVSSGSRKKFRFVQQDLWPFTHGQSVFVFFKFYFPSWMVKKHSWRHHCSFFLVLRVRGRAIQLSRRPHLLSAIFPSSWTVGVWLVESCSPPQNSDRSPVIFMGLSDAVCPLFGSGKGENRRRTKFKFQDFVLKTSVAEDMKKELPNKSSGRHVLFSGTRLESNHTDLNQDTFI